MKMEFQKILKAGCLGLLTATSALAGHDAEPAHGAPEPAAASQPRGQQAAPAAASATRKGVDQTLALIREAALALLKEGNQRFATDQPRHPNQDPARRSTAVAEGQKPFATILACSDSRSPVEVLFDRGVGDLFVVRVAGNVADESQLASIEYGVEHLNTPLLVVLGHTGCGAVTAACQGLQPHGHIGSLIDHIRPAVVKARAVADGPAQLIPAAIQANVWQQMEDILSGSSVVREKVKDGSVQLVGGIYDLEKGTVNWLGGHPTQDKFIAQAEAQEREQQARKAKASQPASTEDEPTPEVAHEAQEHEARPYHSVSKPPPSFPSSILPTKEVKARQKKQPQHGEE